MAGRHAARRERSSPRPYLFAGIIVLALILLTRFVFGSQGTLSASGGKNCHNITVAATPDKAELLRELAAEWVGTEPKVDNQCVQVVVTNKESAAAMTALARGWNPAVDGPRPDVWAPAASTWARQLEARRSAAGIVSIVPAQNPVLAISPLVVAMPRPVAEATGWPAKQLSWQQMLGQAAASAQGQSSPLGPFKLGVSSAFTSTAGLNTLLGINYLAAARAAGGPTPLTTENVLSQPVRATVLGFERIISLRGANPAVLLTTLQEVDDRDARLVPATVTALTLEEKSVWDYNQGNPTGLPKDLGRHPRPKVPLAAVYPEEGTLVSDHPYVVLTAPWVDDAKRQVAAGFLSFLQGELAQAKFQQAGFRNHRGEAGPLATQANGLLGNQRPRLLPPPEPSVLSRIMQVYAQIQKKGNVLAVIDVSGSMKESVPGTTKTRMELAKEAALVAINTFAGETYLGVWEFSTNMDGDRHYIETVELGEMRAPIEGVPRRDFVRARLRALEATNGDTGLYDTTWAAVQHLKQHFQPDRINTVVILTDGKNDVPGGGGLSLEQLLQKLRSQGEPFVRVIAIGYGPDVDQAVLTQIAEASQGRAIPVRDPRDIQKAFITALANF